MAMAIVCRKCGHARQLTIFEIRSGNWKRRPCPECAYVDDGKSEPDEAA